MLAIIICFLEANLFFAFYYYLSTPTLYIVSSYYLFLPELPAVVGRASLLFRVWFFVTFCLRIVVNIFETYPIYGFNASLGGAGGFAEYYLNCYVFIEEAIKVCLLLGILEEPTEVVEKIIVEPGCGVFT